MNETEKVQHQATKLQQDKQNNSAYLCIVCGFCAIFLLACGRARVTPTPIPADVVRPVQPTPVYGKSSDFTLATTTPTTATVIVSATVSQTAPMTSVQLDSGVQSMPRSVSLPLQQTPSALGIATGGAILVERPGGRVLVNLPAGATVTVTGKAAGGRYWAAYTNEGIAGWVPVGQLLLFGADDLIVVSETVGPGPIATLVAQAMQPLTGTLPITR